MITATMEQVEEMVAEAIKQAAEIGLTHRHMRKAPFIEEIGSGGYPFGAQHNFGISIAGAVVTILRAVVKRGGKVYEVDVSTGAEVTITADDDWVALEVTPKDVPGDDTFEFKRYAVGTEGPPKDHDGLWVYPLHQFTLTEVEGVNYARWKFGMYFDGVLGMMGH